MLTEQIEFFDIQDRSKNLKDAILEYPHLLQHACLVVSAMPTTSVSVERLFSLVKIMKRDNRSTMQEDPLCGLVFLKTNGFV